MYSQSFSPRNLYACAYQGELRDSKLSKVDFIRVVDACVGNSINEGSYRFKIRKSQELYLNAHPKGGVERLCQDLILRKLYCNIKRIYGVEQADRNHIVKQMISLLKEETRKWVIRLDVKHFYESIDRRRLVRRFKEDGRLTYQSIQLLENLFNQIEDIDKIEMNGLPRGLSISSVMSELYMKYFDLDVCRMDGVFYYARFVDDIIIFCNSQKTLDCTWRKIPGMLEEMGLKLNESKSYIWDNERKSVNLTYLGYKFIPKGSMDVDVAIAEKKVNVIKTRLTRSFVRFANDGNFDMLKDRVKYLTGNITFKSRSTLLPIKVGIHFNYKYVTEKTALLDLDMYYQRLLHCRVGRLGAKLASRMTAAQRSQLEKYSFVFGFERHVNHYFLPARIADIKSCWR